MAKPKSRRKSKRGGGKRHGKVHHKARERLHFKLFCSPWVAREVYDTRVETPGTELVAKVFARLREKHMACLALFIPEDFIEDLRRYLRYVFVVTVGGARRNEPSSVLPDEEAWLF